MVGDSEDPLKKPLASIVPFSKLLWVARNGNVFFQWVLNGRSEFSVNV
jgi:hypothetical protein